MVDQIRFFAGAARLPRGPGGRRSTWPGHTSFIRREPHRRRAARSRPWNYPMMMAVWKFAPALAAGNTMVLKPSDTTPASPRCSWPRSWPSTCRPACSTSSAATATPVGPWWSTRRRPWCRSPGRCGPAWRWPPAAAPTLKRVHLELGGKAPVVVFDDADIAAAAEGIASAGYFNAGQDCTAATRVLAGPAGPRRLRGGPGRAGRGHDGRAAPTTRTRDFGPLNNANQLAARDAASSSALPAHADGGGRAATGAGTRGLLLRARRSSPGLHQDDEMIQNEVFGPVITVQGSATRTRRSRWANGVEYGLASSVWTRTTAGPCGWPGDLDFGCVWINTHIPLVAEMPHGGFKQLRLRQGPLRVRVRGLHPDQARDEQHRELTSSRATTHHSQTDGPTRG